MLGSSSYSKSFKAVAWSFARCWKGFIYEKKEVPHGHWHLEVETQGKHKCCNGTQMVVEGKCWGEWFNIVFIETNGINKEWFISDQEIALTGIRHPTIRGLSLRRCLGLTEYRFRECTNRYSGFWSWFNCSVSTVVTFLWFDYCWADPNC